MSVLSGRIEGDTVTRCVIRDNDFDRRVDIHIVSHVHGTTGIQSYVDHQGKLTPISEKEDLTSSGPPPLASLSVGETRHLAKELTKWNEKHGYATPPDHAEKLVIELKLVEQERDYLRDLLREVITGNKKEDVLTLAQVDEAVRQASMLQQQQQVLSSQQIVPGPMVTGTGAAMAASFKPAFANNFGVIPDDPYKKDQEARTSLP